MKNFIKILPLAGVGALLTSAFLFDGTAQANDISAAAPQMYEVTITNLTSNQIISPPIVASHNDGVSMFKAGSVASADIQALAEDGDNSGLASTLGADVDVFDVATFAAGIAPGASDTTIIMLDKMHTRLSVAGMLVTTNDAFIGLDSVTDMVNTTEMVFFAPVYDAGTEFNSEDCAFIPGPPCGNGGSHDPTPAEGFIHLSNGIHGQASLAAETYDWGTYGARIEVKRL
jgi:hypothetical protein